jgi:RNA polymerase sigma factor (TIGR02999 family)
MMPSPDSTSEFHSHSGELTSLLQAHAHGDGGALQAVIERVYAELKQLALGQLRRESHPDAVGATALLNEAYLRLVGDGGREWANRRHFFAAAAEAMRRVLVDAARQRNALKRGGKLNRQAIEMSQLVAPQIPEDLIELDEALTRLEQADAEAAQLVKLRYFAGMTMEEAAQTLEISPRTAHRTWDFAKAWLHRELS